jgi:uncharacterized protein DUF4236
MAPRWNFRRSIRLPGGLRVNLSRRGAGYSWGAPGVRFGRDAAGRNYQSYSVPGTGLYSRTYSQNKTRASEERGSFWKWFGIGFVLSLIRSGGRRKTGGGLLFGLLLLLALPLLMLYGVMLLIAEIPIPLIVMAGCLLVVFILMRGFEFEIERLPQPASGLQDTSLGSHQLQGPRSPVSATPLSDAVPQTSDDIAALSSMPPATASKSSVLSASEAVVLPKRGSPSENHVADFPSKVRETVDAICPVLKEALRPVRMASSAHTLVQLEFQQVIYSFGLDETARLSNHAAGLYADIFARLNKRLAGVTPEIIQTTSVDYITAHRSELTASRHKPEILRHLQAWDSAHGTSVAPVLRDLLLQMAVFAAAEDGAVPDVKSTRIEAFARAMDAA